VEFATTGCAHAIKARRRIDVNWRKERSNHGARFWLSNLWHLSLFLDLPDKHGYQERPGRARGHKSDYGYCSYDLHLRPLLHLFAVPISATAPRTSGSRKPASQRHNNDFDYPCCGRSWNHQYFYDSNRTKQGLGLSHARVI